MCSLAQKIPTVQQWGNVNVSANGTNVILPLCFNNNLYKVIPASTWNSDEIGIQLTQGFVNTGAKDTSMFKIKASYDNAMDWIAVGY